MTDKKIWLITGAARGMGVDIAKAALVAGNAVVATARNADSVTAALGEYDDLLAVDLDITDAGSAQAAVRAAVDRFGRIDVLVNNAGNFYAGFFEEISPAQMRAQIETNLFGPMNVTRAVLPVMRRQRSGHVVTISSTAGLIGQEFVAAYAASKFGVEGWMESLRFDVEPFGIRTTVVEPGFFRTELLVEGSSTIWPELSIDDYAERTASTIAAWRNMNGHQGGDPAKLAATLVTITELETAPLRFVAGADAVAGVEQKAHDLLAQVDAYRQLSSNLAHDDAPGTTMNTWTSEELTRIGESEELQLGSQRSDHTFRPYVTMWVVRVGDDLYVRSAAGPANPWYRRAVASGVGRIRAGGIERDATFSTPMTDVHAAIDAAYHTKYDHYGPQIVGTVVGPHAQAVTIRLIPRSRHASETPGTATQRGRNGATSQ